MFRPRIDALPPERHLTGLSRQLLALDVDDTLQTLVEAAARGVGTPMALVSLILDSLQLFRAHVGLPPDLAHACATSRDVSFCQFVVRDDDVLRVEDAMQRPDLPQALVRAYDVRAYLGVPLHLGGQTIGSLCVLDTRPRDFSQADQALLVRLAGEVERRLEQLAADRPSLPVGMMRAAVDPLFSELRNHLSPLMLAGDELCLLSAELRAHLRTARLDPRVNPAVIDLDAVGETLDEIDDVAGSVNESAVGVASGLRLIEGVVDPHRSGADMARVVEQVAGLCRHFALTVGGVEWRPVPPGLRAALSVSTTTVTVASVLNWLIARVRGPRIGAIRAAVTAEGPSIVVTFTHPRLTAEAVDAIAHDLATSGLRIDGLRIRPSDEALSLSLPAA